MLKTKSLLALALVLACVQVRAQNIILGAVAMDAPVEMIKRMTPLAEYLAQRTGYTVHSACPESRDCRRGSGEGHGIYGIYVAHRLYDGA